MNRRLILGLIIASALGAFFVWLELRPTDEAQISEVIERLIADGEKRDIGAMGREISDRYHDGRGLGREEVLHALGAYLERTGWNRILPVRLTVGRIEGDRAEAEAKIILADASGPARRRSPRDALEIDLQLSREGGRWKVLSAEEWEVPTEDPAVAQ